MHALSDCPGLPRMQVVEEKPVLICEVEYIKDEEDPTADTEEVIRERLGGAWLAAARLLCHARSPKG